MYILAKRLKRKSGYLVISSLSGLFPFVVRALYLLSLSQKNTKIVPVFLKFSWFFFYIFSQFDIQSIWLNMLQSTPGCLSVRVCVCVYVFVISTAQTDGPILMKLSTNHLQYICLIHFSPILKIQIWWRHGGHFSCFRLEHSHGRNFLPIFFKF